MVGASVVQMLSFTAIRRPASGGPERGSVLEDQLAWRVHGGVVGFTLGGPRLGVLDLPQHGCGIGEGDEGIEALARGLVS